ncbi:MAG: cache domain-containing protein [Candidatus Nitrosocosmicus sp.]|nr:cache domain-containing protein [Candidatus Nitrosocosmicus sp.]
MMTKPVDAQDLNNGSQQSNYFQEFPTNNTDKVIMLILLANLIDDKISSAVDVLEISSNEEALKNVPFLKNVSSDYNGIHATLDLDKRNLAKDILQRNKDIASIFFVLPSGDIYMGEPYKDQEQLPRINFTDREWYKGVVKNNQTYVSSIFLSASITAPAIATAIPVYSLMSDLHSQAGLSSLSGYWVGIINLRSLENMFESLFLNTDDQFILIDHNGTELFDTQKSNFGPVFHTGPENKSLPRSANNMTSIKLDTFDHLDDYWNLFNLSMNRFNI